MYSDGDDYVMQLSLMIVPVKVLFFYLLQHIVTVIMHVMQLASQYIISSPSLYIEECTEIRLLLSLIIVPVKVLFLYLLQHVVTVIMHVIQL